MKKTLGLILIVTLLSNCSVYLAANQSDKKDLSVLTKGSPRSVVLSGLGQPATTEKDKGIRKDYFYFNQGYSKGTKAGRVALHAVLDLLTFGLWEIFATPTEVLVSGSKTSVEVTYTKDDKVDTISKFSENGDNKIVN